ncbi:MAG TPA: peptide chain release factor N(5)-glutamine methyltransferase [Chlamydiales bacterium]|nr:peptide chain release factor N(5)-glutamine methyltransferase [Chlamydiales bacterium]
MKTIGEVLKLSQSFLEERKIDRPRRTAEDLLSNVLKLKRLDLYLQFDKPVIDGELALLRDLLKKCGRGEPLEYVIGGLEFFGCWIKTDPRVLIPRPETEILVDLISQRVRSGVLWDLCTGSGCMGIALKKKWPELKVTLSDISADALALAAENAKQNGVEVELVQGDLLDPFRGRKADVIVCNPPYISQSEYDHLSPSVRDFEPKGALLGGERGTEFYERLQRELPPFLNPGAQVFFEIGARQGEALKKLFPQGEILPDWAGHPRFLIKKFT